MTMAQIVGQVGAEKQQGVRDHKRVEVFGCVRGLFILLLVVTMSLFAFCQREEMQNMIFPKPVVPADGAVSPRLMPPKNRHARQRG